MTRSQNGSYLNSCKHVYSTFPIFLLKEFEGEIVYYFASWSILAFIGAADRKFSSLFLAQLNTLVVAVVMILRVWAMYSQSRLILGILLVFYAISLTSYLVYCIIIAKDGGMRKIISYYAH